MTADHPEADADAARVDGQAAMMDGAACPSPAPVGGELSALQANIKLNGSNAYYYAHRKRDTGEEPAPLPVHVALERTAPAGEVEEKVETLFTYQFCDEEQVVKIYIPLEDVGSRVEEGDVTTSFETRSFELSVRGYKPNRVVLRLAVRELFGDIVPEACAHRKLANKVVITLRKKDGEKGAKCSRWSKLK